jgi:hypothetical protein
MKKGCLITILIFISLAALFVYGMLMAFDPEYDKAEIKQKLGGTLICNSVYIADHHSWQYNISYKYKVGNKIMDIGSGTYYAREWKKDEQLTQYKNWTILKTGGWYDGDKLIIGDIKINKWFEYEFTPENIERDSLWYISKTHSLLNWCCSESFIEQINNGQIIIRYKFRTSEKQVNEYGQKMIYYKVDDSTGFPKMTKIE